VCLGVYLRRSVEHMFEGERDGSISEGRRTCSDQVRPAKPVDTFSCAGREHSGAQLTAINDQVERESGHHFPIITVTQTKPLITSVEKIYTPLSATPRHNTEDLGNLRVEKDKSHIHIHPMPSHSDPTPSLPVCNSAHPQHCLPTTTDPSTS